MTAYPYTRIREKLSFLSICHGGKMREKDVERKLVSAVRNAGGLALKFVSPGMAGVPDRLLLFPGGRAVFCEVKAPGEKPRPLQVHRMEQLRKLGFRVYVVDSREKVEKIVEEIKKRPVLPAACGTGQTGVTPARAHEE